MSKNMNEAVNSEQNKARNPPALFVDGRLESSGQQESRVELINLQFEKEVTHFV